MNTSSERLDGNLVKLTVTVPAEQVDDAIAEAYKDIAGKVRIPGFRKGRIPRPVIDTHVGREGVLAEAQETVIDRSYPLAIDAEGLRPIDMPDMGELELPAEGAAYTYVAEVAVKPELPLSSIERLVVHAGPEGVTDADIDAQLEQARERFATLEAVERGVEKGDFALISFVGTVDAEAYEGNTVDKYLYETERGLMPPEFDAALYGAMPGAEVVAEFAIPDTSSNEEYVGKQAHFDITVHEVKAKVLPPLDDDFAAQVGGFDTLDALRDDMREKMASSRAIARTQRIEMMARELLASRLMGEVPVQMEQARTSSMLRDFMHNLDERKLSLQDYVQATGVGVEQIQQDISEQAMFRVREELALEALFRQLDLAVTDEDIDAALVEIAGEDGDVETVRADIKASGSTPILIETIMHRKALDWLLANVEVTNDDPLAVELDDDDVEGADASKPTKKRAPAKRAAKKKDTDEAAEQAPESEGEEA